MILHRSLLWGGGLIAAVSLSCLVFGSAEPALVVLFGALAGKVIRLQEHLEALEWETTHSPEVEDAGHAPDSFR